MTDKSNTKTCHLTTTGNVITPKGVLFYSQYLTSAHPDKKGILKYNLELCINPKEVDLKLLKNEMAKIAMENLDGNADAAKKMVERRFIDPNDKPQGGKPAGEKYEGWVLIRASARADKSTPDFIWPNGTKMSSEEAIRVVTSGSIIRATLNPYWSKNAENKGVFLGLQNIQYLEKGEPIGFVKPEGEDEFGAVEGAAEIESSEKSSAKGGESVDALFG